jgi:putative acetyltransferase
LICRDATPADVPWLAAVALQNYREVFAALLPDCDWSRYDEPHFRERFGDSWPRVRIVADGSPLGLCLVTLSHIDMFFIDRAAQGRGVGRRLLEDAERRGARSLESFAVNAGARRFYERAGWRLTDASSRRFAGADCDFVRYEKG